MPNSTSFGPAVNPKYTGKWYENRNYFAIFQAGLDCVTAEYTKSDTGVTVKNEGIRKMLVNFVRYITTVT